MWSRDAGASWLCDNECSADSNTEFADDVDDRLAERTSHACRESNQDDPCRLLSTAVREQAEVFVFGQEHARFRTGQREDDFVLGARIDFYDGGNVFDSIGFKDFAHRYSNSVGLGFRYRTPVGPIRFDVGHNLSPVAGIKATQYFITLGQAF